MSSSVSLYQSPAVLYKLYDDVGSGSDVDLTTDYPGYAQGREKKLPHALICLGTAGNLNMTDNLGNSDVVALVKGVWMPIAPKTLLAASSTALIVMVIW